MDLDPQHHHTRSLTKDLASIDYFILFSRLLLLSLTFHADRTAANLLILDSSGNRVTWTLKSGILTHLSDNAAFVLSPKPTLFPPFPVKN